MPFSDFLSHYSFTDTHSDSSSMGTRARTGGDRLRTVWTPEMDRYFIDLMLEQVGRGNKFDDHLFSKRAWKHMTSLFNTKFNFPYEKDVLKNRHKTLRNLYKAVKILLHQKGFSWDETRQMVTADNNAWDGYIKVYLNHLTFLFSFPNFPLLTMSRDLTDYGFRYTQMHGHSE